MDKDLKEKVRFKHYWRSLKTNERVVWIMGFLLISGSLYVDFDKLAFIEKIGVFAMYFGSALIGFAVHHENEWEKKIKGEHNEQLGK